MNQLDATTRALLSASRHADNPSDEQLSRVERSLLAKLAMGAGASVGVGVATSKAAGATLLAKLAAGAVLAGAALGGTVWLSQREPGAPAPLEPSQAAASAAPAPLPVATAAPAPTPSSETTSVARAEPPASDRKREPAAKPESPALKLKAEAALVSEAQRALGAGRTTEALEKLAQYEQRFPTGALRTEADATRVFALCRSGRTAEGSAAKDAFLRRYPGSPAAPRVRSACRAQ